MYHHLQYIMSSKDSENLEKSVSKGQGWNPTLVACDLLALTCHCMGSGILPGIPVWTQFKWNPKMQVEALSYKKEATYEHDPEMLPSSLGQSSFNNVVLRNGWMFCGGINQNVTFFLEIMGTVSSGLHWFKSLHLWCCGGSLVPISWASYTSGRAEISRRLLWTHQDWMLSHIRHLLYDNSMVS